METRYIGTFGSGHQYKGVSLGMYFVFFAAQTQREAHAWMVERFGNTWSHLYTSPQMAGVEQFKLQQFRIEGDLLFCNFPEHVNAEDERKQAWSDPKGLLEKYGFIFEALGMKNLAEAALGEPVLQKDLITITPEEIENNKLKKAIADLDYTLNKKKKEEENDD